jgi:acyl-CoA synthetase (AMP-forming)/AMP-acid ligase II
LKSVKEQEVTFTIAVSSQLRQIAEILNSPFLPEINSLRCIVSSSALLESYTKKELINKLHCDFHECYGTSEIAIATNLNIVSSKNKLKSVGCAIDNVDVKILKEDNTFAGTNEVGEIVCKTPMLFGGYYKLPELTKQAMFGDYFCTGDIGKIDEEGFLYFLDRKKDLIISGGINIYPSDIEEVILKLDDIAEVAAFPYPDKNLGEVIAVACVLKNKDKFNLRNLKFHCAKYLADFQQPRQYFILNKLPKNNMGKLIKHRLVEMFGI